MPRLLLLFGLCGLGVSAILIGLGLSVFGPDAVTGFFTRVFGLIEIDGEITDLASVNIESELRFFGMMFVFYGACLIWTLLDYGERCGFVPFLLLVFFLAGIGRLIGFVHEGSPHLLFRILMYIELGLPALLMLLWIWDKRAASQT